MKKTILKAIICCLWPTCLSGQTANHLFPDTEIDSTPRKFRSSKQLSKKPRERIFISATDTSKEQEMPVDYQYRLGIGTNFDFLDGIKTKDLFADANILPNNFLGSRGTFLLEIYKNRSISSLDTLKYDDLRTTILTTIPGNADTLNTYVVRQDSFKVEVNFVQNNLNAVITPLWQINATNNSKVRIYVGLRLAFVQREEISFYNYVATGTNRDTIQSLYPPLDFDFTNTTKRRRTYYDLYYGLSLPIILNDNFFHSRIIPSFGFGQFNVPFLIRDGHLYPNAIVIGWAMGLRSDFIEQNSGIRLGFDFKLSGFKAGTPSQWAITTPSLSIYLVKDFSLSKVKELVSQN